VTFKWNGGNDHHMEQHIDYDEGSARSYYGQRGGDGGGLASNGMTFTLPW